MMVMVMVMVKGEYGWFGWKERRDLANGRERQTNFERYDDIEVKEEWLRKRNHSRNEWLIKRMIEWRLDWIGFFWLTRIIVGNAFWLHTNSVLMLHMPASSMIDCTTLLDCSATSLVEGDDDKIKSSTFTKPVISKKSHSPFHNIWSTFTIYKIRL